MRRTATALHAISAENNNSTSYEVCGENFLISQVFFAQVNPRKKLFSKSALVKLIP